MASVSTTSSSAADALTGVPAHNVRWRQLIVDLAAPVFRAPGGLQDDLLLAKPTQMHPAGFQQALTMLQQFRQKHGSGDALVLSPQQIAQLGIAGALSTAGRNIGLTCVSRGTGGELNIFGGLTVYPGCDPVQLVEEFKTLNSGQAAAVRKILLAEDYSLLLGLPGTGKTSTLSLVIRLMIARGQKVLLTSFTHSAVDHLVTKLIEAGMSPAQLLRLGSKSSVHTSVHPFLLEARETGNSVAALSTVCGSVRLVACTVLAAARSKLVRSLCMDCCVMDEAGQIAQPAALGAVLCARSAVLVGDDYQLPPLVVSLEAQSKGMNVSLFKRFMEAHPAAVCSLTIQYRMNADIMSVCNTLIYEHRMTCALPVIASAALHLPRMNLVPSPRGGASGTARTDWLYASLLPQSAVVFLNTDDLACHLTALMLQAESGFAAGRSNSISSESEAALVRDIVTGLRVGGCDLRQVGVICPFRAQVNLIATSMKTTLSAEELAAVEVSTVDKYQGRDKDVIVLSTVKCCLDGKEAVGNLLRDWRRINVAVTR
jgi:DNA replication ATP-dependent helicase Dna2